MMDVRRDIPGGQPGADLDAQARAWIVRLKSGGATELDLRRLAGWRASSPDAERAFDHARRLWAQAGPVLQASGDAKVVALRRPLMSRRAMVGGGGLIAACAVASVYLGGEARRQDTEPGMVLVTEKGQRRRVAIAPGAVAELNTATHARVWSQASGNGLELMSGEVLVTLTGAPTAGQFVAKAGAAVAMARAAEFLLRRRGEQVSVLCVKGDMLVRRGDQDFTLGPNALLSLDGAQAVVTQVRDTVETTAWRVGQLVYKDRPLIEVIGELNRYRNGRIVLRDKGLASRRVSGVVHLDRIDGALTNFARSLDVRIVRLPGDIVVLG
jgi:transmembrane sensor